MPQTQRTIFFLIPDTIITYFFLAHRGQVTRILPSLTLQVCDLPRISCSRLQAIEGIYTAVHTKRFLLSMMRLPGVYEYGEKKDDQSRPNGGNRLTGCRFCGLCLP
jgi:hypothetical protein